MGEIRGINFQKKSCQIGQFAVLKIVNNDNEIRTQTRLIRLSYIVFVVTCNRVVLFGSLPRRIRPRKLVKNRCFR